MYTERKKKWCPPKSPVQGTELLRFGMFGSSHRTNSVVTNALSIILL